MITIPVVPNDPRCRALYFTEVSVPDAYMEDFSKMGLVVDQYDDSISMLQKAGYRLERNRYGASLQLENVKRLAEIRALLLSSSIGCEYGDIADTFYQA